MRKKVILQEIHRKIIYVIGRIEGCLKAKLIIEKENPFPLRLTIEGKG